MIRMNKRIENLLQQINREKLDGFLLIQNEYLVNKNTLYISGFTGSTAYLLISPKRRVLLADYRYNEQASAECPDFEVIGCLRPFANTLKKIVNDIGIKRLGFEVKGITMDMFNEIKQSLSGIELVPTKEIIKRQRRVKDEKEIDLMVKASQMADQIIKHILNFIKPGMKEKDIDIEFQSCMLQLGSPASSPIIASGKRSSLQHGLASEKRVENGDFIVIDFGPSYKGYYSDMTRTVVVGHTTEKQKDVYNIVKRAQQKGINMLKAGAKTTDIYSGIQKIIIDSKYGEYRGRGIGHGLGLEVHEGPYIGERSEGEIPLEVGNVITIEPGIYIPSWGGVRIEDVVIIEKDGCKVLTNFPKELIEL